MKKVFAIALALVMVLCLAACGAKEEPAANNTGSEATTSKNADRAVNLSTLAPLTSFDSCQTNDIQDEFVLYQTNDFLWTINQDTLETEYHVAESVTLADDSVTYTVKLRPNVKFHNGKTVTVEDVLFSWARASEDTHHKSKFANVASMDKVDDSTIKIVLSKADAGFMVAVARHACIVNKEEVEAAGADFMVAVARHACIVNKEEVEAAGADFGTKPHTAGCGPYKWGKVESMDSYWELEAFEDFWGGAPAIKKATYKPITQAASGLIAFEAGELDWYIAPMANWDDLTSNDDYNTELVAANHQSYVSINYSNAELQDINLRKAIAYAINKDECNDVAYSGMAKISNYMYDPDRNVGAPAHDTYYSFNLEKAKEYLAKSCMPNGGKLSGAIQCSAGGYFEKMATVIQANLKAIGLEVEVTPMQSATNMELMREGNYFIGVSGGSPAGDYSGISGWYFSNTAYNKFDDEHDPNDEFDYAWMQEQFAKGNSAKTVEDRKAAYAELDAYVEDRAVLLPIFHKVQPYVWTKDLNVPVNYQDYYDLTEWSWN